MIRIDSLWLCPQPVDMRAGADRLLSLVVAVFGSAQPHHGYLFTNTRANRLKLLVHDGFGIWCAARRLHQCGPAPQPLSSSYPAGAPTRPVRVCACRGRRLGNNGDEKNMPTRPQQATWESWSLTILHAPAFSTELHAVR